MPTFSAETRRLASRCKVYQKSQRGPFYADFRPFARWGGKQEALIPPGTTRATKERSVATALFAARLEAWQRSAEADQPMAGSSGRAPRLLEFSATYLKERNLDEDASEGTLRKHESSLRQIVEYFGDCALLALTPARINDFVRARQEQPGRKPGTRLSNATIRNDLNALANLLGTAKERGYVFENAMEMLRRRPAAPKPRRECLERDECARLLDAAFELDQEARVARRIRDLKHRQRALRKTGHREAARAINQEIAELLLLAGPAYVNRWTEPILEAVASLLLYTGMRHDEALGLLVEDVDFASNVVHVRANQFRALKKEYHERSIRMWPGLRAVLERYLSESGCTSGLLFPSMRPARKKGKRASLRKAAKPEGKRPSISKAFARLVARAGFGNRAIMPHTMRHTYATQMLHTTEQTEHGTETIRTPYVVSKLLGHRNDTLVQHVYVHPLKRKKFYDMLDFESERVYPARQDEWRLLKWQEPALPPGWIQ
jgi:integrase